jgi:hypothetical protein
LYDKAFSFGFFYVFFWFLKTFGVFYAPQEGSWRTRGALMAHKSILY